VTGTITLAAGTTTKLISVPIWSDALADTDEAFTVSLTGVNGAGVALIRRDATATILAG
jgi:hypothetical protein